MIKRLFELRDALDFYDIRNRGFGPKNKPRSRIKNISDEEWRLLNDLQYVLKPLSEAQKVLEGNTYVTSSLVVYIVREVEED